MAYAVFIGQETTMCRIESFQIEKKSTLPSPSLATIPETVMIGDIRAYRNQWTKGQWAVNVPYVGSYTFASIPEAKAFLKSL